MNTIKFEGIFVPPLYGKLSYFIVAPQVYKDTMGFYPITYNEYFHVEYSNKLTTLGNTYLNRNYYYSDCVNMFDYELLYNERFNNTIKEELTKMIKKLIKENKIRKISIEIPIEVEENNE